MKMMSKMVTYGLCQHHLKSAREFIAEGRANYWAALQHLKVVYEGRKRIYNSLHSED